MQPLGTGRWCLESSTWLLPALTLCRSKRFTRMGQDILSDVLRALYFATQNYASVINMSFDFQTSSTELSKACKYSTTHGVVLVASVGNNGQHVIVYPAGLSNVMGRPLS